MHREDISTLKKTVLLLVSSFEFDFCFELELSSIPGNLPFLLQLPTFHAKELIPIETELREWSVVGTIESFRDFLNGIRENRFADEEIVRRMRDAAANVDKYRAVPRDDSREGDTLFYVAARKEFGKRLAVCDLIPGLGLERSRRGKRRIQDETQAEDTVKDFVPEEAYFAGRKYPPDLSRSSL
jgi:hypothetical protein